MKKLVFYGASDDLLELDGDMQGEFDAYTGKAVKVSSIDGEMLVVAIYAPSSVHASVWSIGIAPADEGQPIPEWPMQYGIAVNGYSPALTIICPDDIVVTEVKENA